MRNRPSAQRPLGLGAESVLAAQWRDSHCSLLLSRWCDLTQNLSSSIKDKVMTVWEGKSGGGVPRATQRLNDF